jgi:S2P endopeptidase
MAMLSLYLFNLMPLPYLDGTALLKELIDMVLEARGNTFVYDIEAVEHRHDGPNRREKWRKRVMRLVHFTVGVIVALYVLLALVK